LERLKDSDITWLYGPFQHASTKHPQIQTHAQPTAVTPTKSLLKKPHPAKAMQQRSEYTFSLLREATGFRVPSPVQSLVPEPQQKVESLGVDAVGIKFQEQKRRVVFNEIVVLYREVIEEPEPDQEYLDDLEERWEHFRDFDEDFGGVD
jgi:hypothetical protein